MRMTAAVVEGGGVAGRGRGQVTPVDEETVDGKSDKRGVHAEGTVVFRGVEAARPKSVAMKMGLASTLP